MHHFISYSSVDGQEAALKLAEALEAGPPDFRIWLDKKRLQPDADWDTQVDRAIRTCETLIFIMTPDSVEDTSFCKAEWVRALKFKKPLVLVRSDCQADLPLRLGSRQFIDFSANFDAGLAHLRQYLGFLTTNEGHLHRLRERLADANRDLPRATEAEQLRIEQEVEELREQISRLEAVVEDPAAAQAQAEQSIARRIESERQPAEPIAGRSRTNFINAPPMVAPAYFQDRHIETKMIGNFLKDDAQRLMTVIGRGGVGKTAMVCRLLRALESGRLPDDLGELLVDGIIYLSKVGSHTISAPNLFADLCELLPDEKADRLETLYRDAKKPVRDKLFALLEHFQGQPVVLLLDNLEHLVDSVSRSLIDEELNEALQAILEAPHHTVKVLITTRVAPEKLQLFQPQRQRSLALDEGLESPYAENTLRELDTDGVVGLKNADQQVLGEIRKQTRGFPRALEAFYGILSADRSTTLEELLAEAADVLPETVVETLVGEAFSRLEETSRLVMQALAVYDRPVPPVAVDYLLQPHLPVVDTTAVLNRLVNMHFVRKEEGRFYLHPIDQAYAMSQLPIENGSSGNENGEPLTLSTLQHRAADYFSETRLPRSAWKQLSDLEPQLAEIDLRCAAGEFDSAADVLMEIDFNYLLLWGHARLLVSLRGRLQGRLNDQRKILNNLGQLGSAYWSLGQSSKAIDLYEQTLAFTREIGHRAGESTWLNNLGLAYTSLGQVSRAIECYEQALEIDHEVGERLGVGLTVGNLGRAYWDLGQVSKAIKLYEQALDIDREFGNQLGEGLALGDLGHAYVDLGQASEAIKLYKQALEIDREIGNRRAEGNRTSYLGLAYSALDRVPEAIECYEKSLTIAREVGDQYSESLEHSYLGRLRLRQKNPAGAITLFHEAARITDETEIPECQAEAQMGMAMANLVDARLESAASAAQNAREADYLRHLPAILALEGAVAVRRADLNFAQDCFNNSIRRANELLSLTPQLYAMHEARGLSHCGLALCNGAGQDALVAIEDYRAARRITMAAGIVQDALMLFDALAEADVDGMLNAVRPAIESDPAT